LQVTHEVFGKTTLGKEMYVFKIGNPSGGRILIDACIHGDERVAAEILLLYVDWLLTPREPTATRILERCQTLVIPIVDLDGFTESGTTQGKRKNANNVDLYRNFPYGWELRPDDPARYNYPGPYAESEIETRNMMALYAKVMPKVSISMHTGKPPIFVKQIFRCADTTPEDDVRMRNAYARYVQLARKRSQPVYRFTGGRRGTPGTTFYRYFHTMSFLIETIDTYPNPPPLPNKFPSILDEWLPLFITLSLEAESSTGARTKREGS
jgi:predicted deacylase